MPIPVNVFISYRIESKKHSQQVISLAGRLRAEGINAIIDRYIEAPKEGWPRWIGRQIEEADFVLCVCTPGYRTAFEGRNEPDGGLGVNAEGYYIMQDLYEHGNESDKYIPVLFLGSTGDIPRMLRAFRRYYLPSEYEDLYRRLTGQPSVRQPAIGPRKELPLPKKAPPLWKERIRSGGFEGQDERHFSITPHDYSLAQLAPSEGIALSRIINPPDRFDSSVITTVWVAARGEDQYIIDSVRIKDWAGMPLGPSGGPVLAPDAEYQFTFGEGTDRTHALNPALSVGPQTRPYASFNFCLTPNTPLYTLGHVRVTLNYHTLGGRYGTLMLAQPDKAGVMLARHLRQDMCVSIQDSRYGYDYSEQVVTQEGLQKGYERDFHEYPQYIPIDLLKLELYELGSRKALLHLRNSLNGFFQARERLHDLLDTEESLGQLDQWLSQGYRFTADLLGGIGTDEATQVLVRGLARESTHDAALNGLFVRHILKGDDVLADYVLAHEEALRKSRNLYDSLIIPVLLRPTSKLPAVYKMITPGAPFGAAKMHTLLQSIKADLSAEEYYSFFDPALGPLGVPVFIRGTMNDWGDARFPEGQLMHKGKGKYEATIHLDAILYQFKIADKQWTYETNFGSEAPNRAIELARPLQLSVSNLSHNLILDLSAGQAGLYRFALDANDMTQPTLMISYTG